MKKLTALLLAIVLVLSLCTVASMADDESVAIVLVPEDEMLLTAEDLALFFVDRDAIEEETETSVSWYKETTKDGKTERELVEEMPLIIKITAVGPRIYAADGYIPSLKLVDLVAAYAPEKDPDSEHVYCWHRIFNQDCRWRGLRYGTCKDCFGIEFDLARGNHSYKDGACTVCGRLLTPTATPAPTTAPTADPSSEPTAEPTVVPEDCAHEFDRYQETSGGDYHYRKCSKCDYEEFSNHDDPPSCEDIKDTGKHRFFCKTCGHNFEYNYHRYDYDDPHYDDGDTHAYYLCLDCNHRQNGRPE